MGKIDGRKIMLGILMTVLPALLSAGAAFLYKRPLNELIRNTVMLTMSALTLVFGWYQCMVEGKLDYNNTLHTSRFTAIFICSLLYVCLLPLFPFQVWPIVPLAVALAFFSNTFLGLFSYASVVMFAVFLAEASTNVFFLYFLSGAVAVLLFRQMDEAFHVGIPMLISLLFFLLAETASIVISLNERLSWEIFVLPVMNVCLTGLLLIGVLKYFSFSIIHRYRNRYQEINDPEFELMAEMKKEEREDYFLALHTAYFSERIAAAIHANVALAKAGAYYHRIGRIYREKRGDTAKEEEIIKRVCEENEFPPDIEAVLLECAGHHFGSKESTIVMFSDAIVSAVQFLLAKEPSAKPDYEQVVNVIFKKKQENGSLNESSITLHELMVMKQIFIQEKLYYDFLR